MPPARRTRRQRGDGSLFQRSNGLWVARVDLGIGGDGRRRSREVSSMSYATAAAKLKALRRQIEDHGGAPGVGLTLEAWLTYWLTDVAPAQVKPTTLAAYRSCVTQHINPVIGKYRLGKLEPRHVREMRVSLEARDKPLAQTTILKAQVVLAKALKDAQREGKVNRNVAELVARPKPPQVDKEPLTPDQVKAFLRANSGDRLIARWVAAFFTGERQGELLGMEWNRVDLDAGEVDVSWQLQRLGYRHTCGQPPAKGQPWPCGVRRAADCRAGSVLDVPRDFTHRRLEGGLVLTRPKSKKGARLVPLHPFLVAALRLHAATQEANPHGLVFTRPGGRPLDPRVDLSDWYAALALAGLPRSGTHIARHTTAQLLRAGRTDRDVMKDLMGHTTEAVTSAYLHTDMVLAREAMTRLGDLLALEP